jgi:hypothetical protein
MAIKYLKDETCEDEFYRVVIQIFEEASVGEQVNCIFKTPALLMPQSISSEPQRYYDALFRSISRRGEEKGNPIVYIFPLDRFKMIYKEHHVEIGDYLNLLEIPAVDLRVTYSEDFPSMILGKNIGAVALKNPNTCKAILAYILKDEDLEIYREYYIEIAKGARRITVKQLMKELPTAFI